MIKFFSAILVRIIILYYALVVLTYFEPVIYYCISKVFFNNSYVAKIETPEYGTWTKEILEEFSSYEDNKIITFKPLKYGRAINIKEVEANFLPDDVIGKAYPLPWNCQIYLQKGLSYSTFREVLLHEYLHCMGFMHEYYDKKDLMYPSITYKVTEESIRNYAKKLRNRFYGQ